MQSVFNGMNIRQTIKLFGNYRQLMLPVNKGLQRLTYNSLQKEGTIMVL